MNETRRKWTKAYKNWPQSKFSEIKYVREGKQKKKNEFGKSMKSF